VEKGVLQFQSFQQKDKKEKTERYCCTVNPEEPKGPGAGDEEGKKLK